MRAAPVYRRDVYSGLEGVMNRVWAIAAILAVTAGAAAAQEVPTEVSKLGRQQVTLHLHPFLSPEELATLRVVATNEEALKLFVTRPGRHSAVAVAPDEGFIREGQPVASASALSDLPNADAARTAALTTCDAARGKGAQCVVVLEVAPAR